MIVIVHYFPKASLRLAFLVDEMILGYVAQPVPP